MSDEKKRPESTPTEKPRQDIHEEIRKGQVGDESHIRNQGGEWPDPPPVTKPGPAPKGDGK
jgi:hypothetical protein